MVEIGTTGYNQFNGTCMYTYVEETGIPIYYIAYEIIDTLKIV